MRDDEDDSFSQESFDADLLELQNMIENMGMSMMIIDTQAQAQDEVVYVAEPSFDAFYPQSNMATMH